MITWSVVLRRLGLTKRKVATLLDQSPAVNSGGVAHGCRSAVLWRRIFTVQTRGQKSNEIELGERTKNLLAE